MDWEWFGVTAAALVAGLTLVGLAARGLVAIFRTSRRLFALVDRIAGVPAHGTRAAVSGALDRIDELVVDVAGVRAQLGPNGGGSLRDVVDGTRTELAQLDRRFTDHLMVWHGSAPDTSSGPPGRAGEN